MARNTAPPAATVKLVRERDDWRCARCGSTYDLTTQHRVARGMGGTRWPGINLPSNLLTLCGSGTTGCHGEVEAHPVWAQAHGWSVRRHLDPADVPVWTWRGWVLIDNHLGPVEWLRDCPGVDDCACGCRATETSGLFEPATI